MLLLLLLALTAGMLLLACARTPSVSFRVLVQMDRQTDRFGKEPKTSTSRAYFFLKIRQRYHKKQWRKVAIAAASGLLYAYSVPIC